MQSLSELLQMQGGNMRKCYGDRRRQSGVKLWEIVECAEQGHSFHSASLELNCNFKELRNRVTDHPALYTQFIYNAEMRERFGSTWKTCGGKRPVKITSS
jgi:hypothetical protein